MRVALYTHPLKDPKLEAVERTADRITALGGTPLFGNEFIYDFDIDSDRLSLLSKKLLFCDYICPGIDADLMICLGGDGTILRAAKLCCDSGIPIVGVNFGRIGYLAELESYDNETLDRVISDISSFAKENRMLLSAELIRNGKKILSGVALNEASVARGSVSRMIDIEVSCNGQKVCGYRADGFIAATPTGSTAYAMSAGGPIIDPSIECILTLPVCPYLSVNSSPLVYSPTAVIEVKLVGERCKTAFLTLDGEENFELMPGDIVRLTRYANNAVFVKLRSIDFSNLLNVKLTRECGETALFCAGKERGTESDEGTETFEDT